MNDQAAGAAGTRDPSRRGFLGGVIGAGAGSLLVGGGGTARGAAKKRRYAMIGTGHRGTGMWGADVVKDYPELVEVVGLCDSNPKRVETGRRLIGVNCPTFTRFDEMCDKTKPDLLAVMTTDATHADYIVRALDRGIDVLTEKPMVVDELQCQAVLDAELRNRRKITVTFNYRYARRHQHIKEILQSGQLGKVLSVAFDWHLDTGHGADYFRRWHRLQSQSGSLFVHKATHHFDLMNWWLEADPVEVSARARVAVYGKAGPFRHTHCRPCPHKSKCNFHYDITKNERQMAIYVANESADGYLRDGCVYRTDVDTYDTMTALVTYSNGVVMNYSLNAYMPYEGYQLVFTCERGTLAARLVENEPPGDEADVVVTKSFSKQPPAKQHFSDPDGNHGGGDKLLRDLVFRNTPVAKHLALPGSRAGAMSCLTGIAARKSVAAGGQPIKVASLIKLPR